MPALEITVRWLVTDGLAAYHGQEWPPSPARVFRALLAGAHRPGGAGDRGERALRRLESVAPPVIVGPAVDRMEPVKASVPNNDGDRILSEYLARRPDRARLRASKLRTFRLRQPWAVSLPVQYRWTFPEPDPDPEAFQRLAEGMTLLGHGTDLAVAVAKWHDEERPKWGYTWTPDVHGVEGLAVPAPGEVDRLTEAHAQARSRVQGWRVQGGLEPDQHVAWYTDPLAPPPVHWQAYILRMPDESAPWSVAGSDGLRVAGMVRHAIHKAAQTAGLDEAAITELMGHGGDGRINVLSVPNVAHRWADGRVRRIMITAGPAVNVEHWNAVALRLGGAELVAEGANSPEAIMVPIVDATKEKLLWRFVGSSQVWTSASAVILPGFDTRRGRPRPGRAAQRLLRHAGIPAEAVRRIRMDHAPPLPGVQASQAVSVPRHLRDYPRVFVTLEFHREIRGPLAIGAGIGSGLGLLIRCETFGAACNPGERSRDANLGEIR